MEKIFSFDNWFWITKLAKKFVSSVYLPEFRMALVCVITSAQRGVPVYTCAFRYNLASSACANHLVILPYVFLSTTSVKEGSALVSSLSTKANTSARGRF